MSDKITIYEVGPRDGLQNEKTPVSTEDKIKYINMLSQSGLKFIEATSFVKPGTIPQLADAAEVYPAINKTHALAAQVRFLALTPNERGMQNAMAAGVQEVAIFTAASDAFTKKNINCTVEESFTRFKPVVKIARENNIPVRGYVSTVVECPYSGRVQPVRVLEISQRLLDLGVYQISLGETIGVAVPTDIAKLLDTVCPKILVSELAGHFHDTRGTALSNVFEALKYGLRKFDASSAGLGGCPYAPGAAGNLSTEDLVYALERAGYDTGVNLQQLTNASAFILSKINRPAMSRVFYTMQKSTS